MCFSCGKSGHRVSRCPEINETFPYMLPGWSAEKVGGNHMMISPRVAAERLRRLIWGGRSAARISNELRPPDPSGGDVWITASRAETFALPVDTYGRGSGCEEYVHFPLTWSLLSPGALTGRQPVDTTV